MEGRLVTKQSDNANDTFLRSSSVLSTHCHRSISFRRKDDRKRERKQFLRSLRMFCLRFPQYFSPGIPSYSAQHGNVFAGFRLLCAPNILPSVTVWVDEWIIKSHNDTKRKIIAAKTLPSPDINKEAWHLAAEWSQSQLTMYTQNNVWV